MRVRIRSWMCLCVCCLPLACQHRRCRQCSQDQRDCCRAWCLAERNSSYTAALRPQLLTSLFTSRGLTAACDGGLGEGRAGCKLAGHADGACTVRSPWLGSRFGDFSSTALGVLFSLPSTVRASSIADLAVSLQKYVCVVAAVVRATAFDFSFGFRFVFLCSVSSSPPCAAPLAATEGARPCVVPRVCVCVCAYLPSSLTPIVF